MSLVFKLQTAHAAPQPVTPHVGEGLVPSESRPDASSLEPVSQSHLAPCPHCGSPNGLSASTCWNCEAGLLLHEAFRRRRLPLSSNSGQTQPSTRVDDTSLESKAETKPPIEHSVTQQPAALPPPVPGEVHPRRRRFALLLFAAVTAVGVSVYLEPAQQADRFADVPQPSAIMTTRGAPAVHPADRATRLGPAAVAETRTATLLALAVEPGRPMAAQPLPEAPSIDPVIPSGVTQPSPSPASTAPKERTTRKTRVAPHASHVATAPSLRKAATPELSPSPVSSRSRPCTATVATLGLCTAPPNESKE